MKPTLILFPHEPFSQRKIDSEFAAEFEAAISIGFPVGFYSHEDVENGDLSAALATLSTVEESQPLILRGWMLPGEKYGELYHALLSKNYQPETHPEGYEQAHYLPLAYPLTEGHTPKSAWITGDDAERAWDLYLDFQQKEAIIKDWVKSSKSRWKEGCYIPAETSKERFYEIYKVFREERGKLFNRGVVLREFMPIVEKGSDIRGLPIIEETRLFFWKGKLINFPNPTSPSPLDEIERWESIARRFLSHFITIDVALLTKGSWKVVEVGDGGVSGLPMTLDPVNFYGSLWNRICS